MADIFISYKREDKAVAERLERALEQLGFDVWWDFELLSGDRFRKVIEKVIDQCGAAVVLWSTLSRESEFVLDEATYAKEQNKLCPARLDDCRLPMGFGQAQVADLRGWQGEISNPGFDELVRSIEARTGKKARLGARARTEVGEAKLEELDAFKAAEIAGNATALKAFLQQFPNGLFGDFVRSQLHGMGEAVDPAPRTPQATPRPAPPRAQLAPEPLEAAAPLKQTPPFFSGERRFMIIAAALAIIAAVAVTWGLMKPPPKAPPNPPATPVVAVSQPASAPTKEEVKPTTIFDELMLTPSKPHNLDRLDPNVRSAVEDARAAETRALEAAGRARAAVQSAVDASVKAQSGASGFTSADMGDVHYDGASSATAQDGYGVAVMRSGRFKGDGYSGEFRNGVREGVGVYAYADREGADTKTYEGEWRADAMDGWGVLYWRNGEVYRGRMANGQRAGAGVFSLPDGSRYEGQYSGNERTGYGVEWDAKGNARFTGKWMNNELVQDLSGSN